jgi:hypothetical protein
MSAQIIPLDNKPNQSFQVSLDIDGHSLTLDVTLRYNAMGAYWIMSIANATTGELILDSIPLITGDFPAANILGQFSHLNIGSAYVLNVSNSILNYPDNQSLGSDFVLCWDDTP